MALQSIINGMRQSWNDGCLTIVSSLWLQHRDNESYKKSDIPYPSPADRRDLENLVKGSWDSNVQKPMGELTDYGSDQFHHAKEWIFDTYVLRRQLNAHLPANNGQLVGLPAKGVP